MKGTKKTQGTKMLHASKDPITKDLLAIQLFRVGVKAAVSADAERFQASTWETIGAASRSGWRAVAKYVFENYDLKQKEKS